MKNTAVSTQTAIENLRAALIEAFKDSGISNAEFARRCGISPAHAWNLHQAESTPKLESLERGLKALGKRIEIRIVALLVALLPLAAIAQAPHALQPCAVIAHAVIHTYTGPIEIDQLCMTVTRHTGNALLFEARDMADGIFRDGFDGTP